MCNINIVLKCLYFVYSYLGLGLMSARQAVLNFTTLRENGENIASPVIETLECH